MLDRIAVRGGALSALAITAGLLMAATRTTPAPHGTAALLAGRDTAVVRTATLNVKNDAFSDRLIYVTMAGKRQWLGVASAGGTTDFTVPGRYVAGRPVVQFITNPYGGSPLAESQPMHLIAGDTVQMVIQPGS